MTTDPFQELNIALAGPKWFKLRKDGIGFWLKTVDGYLRQISDSMPKKLFLMRAFVWYVVDVTYDIEAGTYDLTIRQDGLEAPVAAVRAQPNASNQPGSGVDKFSFIGDHATDESSVVYYVDDVLLGVDEAIVHQPFAAPGRRKLFVDYWNSAQREHASHPSRLPMMNLDDLGIGPAETIALRQDQAGDLLGHILSGAVTIVPDNLSNRSRAILQSVTAWRAGSAALKAGDAKSALAQFDQASLLASSSPLFKMDAVIALAHLARWDEVDRRLVGIAPQWRDDPRLPATLAIISLARGDLDAVERRIREGAESSEHRARHGSTVAFSPDGRWIAYSNHDEGESGISVGCWEPREMADLTRPRKTSDLAPRCSSTSLSGYRGTYIHEGVHREGGTRFRLA